MELWGLTLERMQLHASSVPMHTAPPYSLNSGVGSFWVPFLEDQGIKGHALVLFLFYVNVFYLFILLWFNLHLRFNGGYLDIIL